MSFGAAAPGPGIEPAEAARLMRLATYTSVAVALLLIAVKAVAWGATGSVAMLSSLVDSLLDAGASLVTLMAVRHALTPPDAEHRFGHGKAEPLAGLGQAALVAGSAVFLLFQAGARLIRPEPVSASALGVAVMVFAIFATFCLVLFQRRVVKRTGSHAVGADSLHYLGDLLSNAAVILALVLSGQLGWHWADPLLGMAIAVLIMHGAWQIFRGAYDHLMDREFPEEQREQIRAVVMRHPEVRALHDLRTRTSGLQSFIQLHMELDGQMTLLEAHRVADSVEAELEAQFPGTEVIIHQDPAGISEVRPTFASS